MKELGPKLYSWASILDEQTEKQAQVAATMPFVHHHIALMPDAHLGKGATVGSVIPTLRAIIPAAVGVDIGCGMIAVRTQFTAEQLPKDRKPLREAIERAIPLSAGNYNGVMRQTAYSRVESLQGLTQDAGFNPSDYAKNWELQLGTLGSGNHFIEVSLDEEERVWLFLHSGSRGVGNKIAMHHIEVAQRFCKKHWIQLPKQPKAQEHDTNEAKTEWDLAYLVEGTPEFDRYIAELLWAQQFALMNREEMMDRLVEEFGRWMGVNEFGVGRMETRVNCHHNYTERERHFGEEVWLSRKGAIAAQEGKLGLVPGSMGTRSYVVVGKGNRMAMNSSPHGAGRAYGRKHAERTFTTAQLVESMQGIEWNVGKASTFLDEIPSAYKSIDQVMEDSKDLVEVKHTLRQIINVKGD